MTTGIKGGNGQNDGASSSDTHRNSLHAPPLPHLPFDLVREILCRLHVKHLLQLRCVCKSWNSLISEDSKFAKKHLHLSTSNHDRRYLILTSTRTSPEFVLSDFLLSSIFSTSVSALIVTQPRYRSFSNKISFGRGVSTCHGIVCFGIDDSLALLCNPFIGKSKILPPLKNPDHHRHIQTSYTLVHDRFIDNYKIIALSSCNNKTELNVHTLGTDNWKTIQDNVPSQYYIIHVPGIFVCDTVNWFAFDHSRLSPLIVSLHLNESYHRKLLLPPHVCPFQIQTPLGELRGCLCILSLGVKFSDVWIMNEYGNEQSWTKLFSVPQLGGELTLHPYTKIVYISEDHKQVLLEFVKLGGECNLVVYDYRNNTIRILEIQNFNGPIEPNIYIESLISPFS